ncbi:MAG TPA: Flp family type IVb pilin [Aestuariivirga sp.]
MFKKFFFNTAGATAIEYTLIAAMMALVLVTVMGTVTGSMKNQINTIITDINNSL